MGCGAALCNGLENVDSGYEDAVLLACNYYDAGNWEGQSPYEIGTACRFVVLFVFEDVSVCAIIRLRCAFCHSVSVIQIASCATMGCVAVVKRSGQEVSVMTSKYCCNTFNIPVMCSQPCECCSYTNCAASAGSCPFTGCALSNPNEYCTGCR